MESLGETARSSTGPFTPLLLQESPSSASVPSQSSHPKFIHARACDTCQERKVKCDKQWPCSSCHKSKRECIYGDKGSNSGRSRRPLYRELRQRLAYLEVMVKKAQNPASEGADQVSDMFGELVVDEQGKSRYLSGSFWRCLSTEVGKDSSCPY